jgi:hypothetical protein
MVGVRNDEWYCEDRKCKGTVECIFLEWVMPLIYYKHHGKTSTVAGIILPKKWASLLSPAVKRTSANESAKVNNRERVEV